MKKMIVLLVAISLILISLAGCQSGNTGAETQSPATKAPTTAAQTQAPTPEPTDDGIPDYLNMDGYIPIVNEGAEITLTGITNRQESAYSDPNDVWLTAYIENVLNINLELEGVMSSAASEKRNLLFASQELPDMIISMGLGATELVKYGQIEGQLMAINEYIPKIMTTLTAKIAERPNIVSNISCPDGNIYALPQLSKPETIGNNWVHVNETWLEALDMDRPETLDEFYDMLVAFRDQDPGQVGSENVIALGGCSKANPSFYIWHALGFVGAGGYSDPMLRDGQVEILAGSPDFKEFLTFMNKLYTEGLIDEDFFTMESTEAQAQFAEGIVGVYPQAAYVMTPEIEEFQKWVALSPLTSDVNDTPVFPRNGTYGVTIGKMALSATCEHPEAALRLWDWIYTDIGSVYSWYGPTSSDTDILFDVVKGWSMTEENVRTYYDVEDGTWANGYAYLCGGVSFSYNWLGDNSDSVNIIRKAAGYEPQDTDVYDLTNGDQWYRASLKEYCEPYFKDSYPSNIYFSEEESTRLNDLKTVIKDYVDTAVAQFVTGSKSIDDDLDAYYDDLEDLGFDEYQQYYIDGYANYLAALNN